MRVSGMKMGANPVIIKELRSRMRGPRAFAILTAFLLLLGAFTYGLYRIMTYQQGIFGGGTPMGAMIGRSVFVGLAFFELGLVCIITPALTAGAISSEEERKTLDMLLATPLHPASVLWGKLVSALSYVFLLIAAAIPMASIVFIFGGVTATDMILALVILVLSAITFGTLGLFFSVWLRRSGRATVASYIVLLLLMFGTYFLYIVAGVVRNSMPPQWLLLANPIAAMASAASGEVGSQMMGGGIGYPLSQLVWMMGGLGQQVVMGGMNQDGQVLRPLWHYTAGIYTVATVVLLLVTVQLLKPIRRWRFNRRTNVALAVSLILILGAAYAFYGPMSYERFGVPVLPTPTPGPQAMPAMARAVAVKEVRVPAPSVEVMDLDTLPEGAEPEDLADIYAAAVGQVLVDGPHSPKGVALYDALNMDLLQDEEFGSLEPIALPADVFDSLTKAIEHSADLAVEIMPFTENVALHRDKMLSADFVSIALGSPDWVDQDQVKVAVSRYYSQGPYDARIYTLARGEDGWTVLEDSGALVKG